MSTIRQCEGCEFLNKKRKTNPCNKDLLAVYDADRNIYIRAKNCRLKTKKVNKVKQLKKLKQETVDLFQKYIRYRDNFTCCCCGFFIDSKDKDATKLIHAGHFLSRTIKTLLMDEKNVNAQCRNCNAQQDWIGIDPRYCSYMVKKYGVDVFDYLYKKKVELWVEPTYEQWLELRDYWKSRLEEFNDKRK